MSKGSIVCYSIIIGVVLNLVLPKLLMPFATQKEIKPPKGAAALSFKEQLMHMFVHHAQVPLTSSIIIAVIIGISVCIGCTLSKTKTKKSR